MAKKKVEKKVSKDITISSDTQILRLTHEIKSQAEDISKLEQRIDRIVIAHTKCKSLKGM